MTPSAPYTRTLGGQARMIGSRQTKNAATIAASTITLPTHASSNAARRGARTAGGTTNGPHGAGATRDGAGGSTAGATGSATASITGGAGRAATGAHWPPQRAQRTTRPGASGPGTSYSAEQEGQVIRTTRSCGSTPPLATGHRPMTGP